MKTELHHFVVKSSAPPTVEVDAEAESVYVRFKKGHVARTVTQPCENMHIAIDLNAHNEVLGIEAVGLTTFSIHLILQKASVKAPSLDFSRAKYVRTDLAAA